LAEVAAAGRGPGDTGAHLVTFVDQLDFFEFLVRLAERPMRYTELAHEVREVDSVLADGVLSKNLKRLAASGLVGQPYFVT